MLEDLCGHDNLRAAFHDIIRARGGDEAGYEELRAAAESASRRDLAEIFRIWLNRPGMPDDFRARYGHATSTAGRELVDHTPRHVPGRVYPSGGSCERNCRDGSRAESYRSILAGYQGERICISVGTNCPRPATQQVVDGDVARQTERVLENLKGVVEAAGSSLDRVVKTTVFLADINDFSAMNEVYARYFTKQPPARSTVEVARLPRDVRVEIDLIALL